MILIDIGTYIYDVNFIHLIYTTVVFLGSFMITMLPHRGRLRVFNVHLLGARGVDPGEALAKSQAG